MHGHNDKKVIPPVGLYEHKFNKSGGTYKSRNGDKKVGDEGQMDPREYAIMNAVGEITPPHTVDMKYIEHPHHHKAETQAFSCFADTQRVDFTRGQTRDEVSFYKKLARTEQAKALGIDLKDYEDLIKMHKSGKYIVNFVKITSPNQGDPNENKGTNASNPRPGTEDGREVYKNMSR